MSNPQGVYLAFSAMPVHNFDNKLDNLAASCPQRSLYMACPGTMNKATVLPKCRIRHSIRTETSEL
eukprot:2027843-Amphidinium_carterae.1